LASKPTGWHRPRTTRDNTRYDGSIALAFSLLSLSAGRWKSDQQQQQKQLHFLYLFTETCLLLNEQEVE
jgi:hypothetical protein